VRLPPFGRSVLSSCFQFAPSPATIERPTMLSGQGWGLAWSNGRRFRSKSRRHVSATIAGRSREAPVAGSWAARLPNCCEVVSPSVRVAGVASAGMEAPDSGSGRGGIRKRELVRIHPCDQERKGALRPDVGDRLRGPLDATAASQRGLCYHMAASTGFGGGRGHRARGAERQSRRIG